MVRHLHTLNIFKLCLTIFWCYELKNKIFSDNVVPFLSCSFWYSPFLLFLFMMRLIQFFSRFLIYPLSQFFVHKRDLISSNKSLFQSCMVFDDINESISNETIIPICIIRWQVKKFSFGSFKEKILSKSKSLL